VNPRLAARLTPANLELLASTSAVDGVFHGFLLQAGNFTTNRLSPLYLTWITSINHEGDTVGFYNSKDGTSMAAREGGGRMVLRRNGREIGESDNSSATSPDMGSMSHLVACCEIALSVGCCS
jgi:hypothetical protein